MSSGYGDGQALPGALSLGGAARSRANVAISANFAAAEKIGAYAACRAGGRGRGAFHRAIHRLSDAIANDGTLPELYIERGGLLARDRSEIGGGGEGAGEAASDFATALWLYGRRRCRAPTRS